MKNTLFLLTALALPTAAQLNIPSDGSDGALNPTADIEIDLSQAITGTWSDDNTGANIGKGIYDPEKWAVVFEYSSVNIPAGVTVTFKNHPSNPPVMWLVSGNVTIDGSVDLQGESVYSGGLEALVPSLGGPGGFRGGASGPEGNGDGLGMGGAGASDGDGTAVFRSGRHEYGNPQLVPLIGGSGGSGTSSTAAGSGGGGAILVASATTITLNGTITCRGGHTYTGNSLESDRRGAGGGIRLIADSILENDLGAKLLDCRGGDWVKSGPDDTNVNSNSRANGRIRIEANNYSGLTTFPETVAVAPADPPQIFAPANAATVTIVGVDQISTPSDPTAPLQSNSDVAIQNNDPVVITLQTTNFPLEGVVQVRVARKFGNAQFYTASNTGGNIASATWELTHTFSEGFTTLQARATAP